MLRGLRLWLVFLAVFVAHVNSAVITSGDSRWFIPTALSIIHHHDVNLDEYNERVRAEGYYATEWVGGHSYNLFPIGTALVALPVVWAIDFLLDEAGNLSLEEQLMRERSEKTERFIASLVVALAAVLVLLLAERQLGAGPGALLVAGVFAFATPAWSTASRALWQHGPSMLLLAGALLLLARAEEDERAVVFVGPLLALAYIVRPTNMLSLALLMGAVLLRHRRRFPGAVLLSLLVLGPFVALNLSIYGTPLPPYFRASQITFGPGFPEALAGTLVSPNRGLFVFSPVLLLCGLGVFLRARARRLGVLDAALLAVVVLHWVVISAFPHWWGGYSIGPRYFADVVPYLVWFLIPVVGEITGGRGVRRDALALVFAGLLAVSVLVNWRCATRLGVPQWNTTPVSVDERPDRVWDWRDLQFRR